MLLVWFGVSIKVTYLLSCQIILVDRNSCNFLLSMMITDGLLLVSLIISGSSCQKIKVFQTTSDNEQFRDGSGAKLKNAEIAEDFGLPDFTVCFRFFFFAKRDSMNILIHDVLKIRREKKKTTLFRRTLSTFVIDRSYRMV